MPTAPRSVGGQWRYARADGLALLGEDDAGGERTAAVDARVSTAKQAEAGNVERQRLLPQGGLVCRFCSPVHRAEGAWVSSPVPAAMAGAVGDGMEGLGDRGRARSGRGQAAGDDGERLSHLAGRARSIATAGMRIGTGVEPLGPRTWTHGLPGGSPGMRGAVAPRSPSPPVAYAPRGANPRPKGAKSWSGGRVEGRTSGLYTFF